MQIKLFKKFNLFDEKLPKLKEELLIKCNDCLIQGILTPTSAIQPSLICQFDLEELEVKKDNRKGNISEKGQIYTNIHSITKIYKE